MCIRDSYRIAYAMARALENYAIIGDHDEGTPRYKGDKALLRAIEVLESVREEGQDKAEHNSSHTCGAKGARTMINWFRISFLLHFIPNNSFTQIIKALILVL